MLSRRMRLSMHGAIDLGFAGVITCRVIGRRGSSSACLLVAATAGTSLMSLSIGEENAFSDFNPMRRNLGKQPEEWFCSVLTVTPISATVR